jgi:hypothetical protein
VENKMELKITIEDIKKQYTQAIKDRLELIKSECNKLRVDFVAADINKGFDQILFPFLIKRSKLK